MLIKFYINRSFSLFFFINVPCERNIETQLWFFYDNIFKLFMMFSFTCCAAVAVILKMTTFSLPSTHRTHDFMITLSDFSSFSFLFSWKKEEKMKLWGKIFSEVFIFVLRVMIKVWLKWYGSEAFKHCGSSFMSTARNDAIFRQTIQFHEKRCLLLDTKGIFFTLFIYLFLTHKGMT